MNFTWQSILVVVIMIVLDIIFGLLKAWKNNDIQSEKMREGLWHKAGYCGLIALAIIYEIATQYLNIESASQSLGITIPEFPAVTAICVYVVVSEAISIVENLCELNPDIAKLPGLNSLALNQITETADDTQDNEVEEEVES